MNDLPMRLTETIYLQAEHLELIQLHLRRRCVGEGNSHVVVYDKVRKYAVRSCTPHMAFSFLFIIWKTYVAQVAS